MQYTVARGWLRRLLHLQSTVMLLDFQPIPISAACLGDSLAV